MRTMVLIYHEDLEDEITGRIKEQMVVARYTKIRDVVGARADFLQENDIPMDGGKNHMLILVAEQKVITELSQALRTLRERHGHGLRGYVTPVEDII